ncbi:MAG: hypothetical protein ACK52I_30550 [Pseudomonadota bacterium]|uniref:hypothetical protein n=1 Tax=Silanimonas sp. TaxID=1929290 RepID=UPI0022C59E56|nr:hypothetical protein [Silanimonas sp.]MCZ8116407.1 hypothetical protein [Silanimonas sp.]
MAEFGTTHYDSGGVSGGCKSVYAGSIPADASNLQRLGRADSLAAKRCFRSDSVSLRAFLIEARAISLPEVLGHGATSSVPIRQRRARCLLLSGRNDRVRRRGRLDRAGAQRTG